MPTKRFLIRGETGFCGAYHEEEVEIEYTDEADLKEQLEDHEKAMHQQLEENLSVEIEEIEEDEDE